MFLIVTASVLTVVVENLISRGMDTLWELEPPEEIVRLNKDLQASTSALNDSSKQLHELIASLSASTSGDDQLSAGLDELSTKLTEFDELLKQTSANTEKITTYSELLQQDYARLRSRSDGMIDGLPNLVLNPGEAVRLCGGSATFGIDTADEDGIRYTTGAGYARRELVIGSSARTAPA